MESFIVSPAVEADGVRGNGRTSCAPAIGANSAPSTRLARVKIVFRFMFISLDSVWCQFREPFHFLRSGVSELEHDLQEHRVSLQPVLGVELVEPLEVRHEVHVARFRFRSYVRKHGANTDSGALEGTKSGTGAAVTRDLLVIERVHANSGQAFQQRKMLSQRAI